MIYADGMHGRFRLGYGAQFLHVAATIAEDRAEINRLVADGADPNARDAGGCTPLHYAAYNNPVGEVAAALFEVWADPEACDGLGSKPLNYAAQTARQYAMRLERQRDGAPDDGPVPGPGGHAAALNSFGRQIRSQAASAGVNCLEAEWYGQPWRYRMADARPSMIR